MVKVDKGKLNEKLLEFGLSTTRSEAIADFLEDKDIFVEEVVKPTKAKTKEIQEVKEGGN